MLSALSKLSCIQKPVDTRRRFNVYKTPMRSPRRRIEVLQMLKRYRVSTGSVFKDPAKHLFL